MCHLAEETVDHVLSGCKKMGFGEYMRRHNSVAKVVLKAILERFGVKWQRQWWKGAMPGHFELGKGAGEGGYVMA
jgi:molybdopterin biosynthesis enzyme MoaB